MILGQSPKVHLGGGFKMLFYLGQGGPFFSEKGVLISRRGACSQAPLQLRVSESAYIQLK